MKSKDQIKDEVAKKRGLKDWNDLIEYHTTPKYKDLSPLITEYYDEAMEAYAEEKAKDAWDRACEKQKRACKIKACDVFGHKSQYYEETILAITDNAPKPEYEP